MIDGGGGEWDGGFSGLAVHAALARTLSLVAHSPDTSECICCACQVVDTWRSQEALQALHRDLAAGPCTALVQSSGEYNLAALCHHGANALDPGPVPYVGRVEHSVKGYPGDFHPGPTHCC